MCSKCYNGYSLYLDKGKLTCMKTPSLIPKCKLVSSNQTYCFNCTDYYYWDNVTLTCLPYSQNCPDLCMYCPVPDSGS